MSIVVFEHRVGSKIIDFTVYGIIDCTAGGSFGGNSMVAETAGNTLIVTEINRIPVRQKIKVAVVIYGTALCGCAYRRIFLSGRIAVKSKRAA